MGDKMRAKEAAAAAGVPVVESAVRVEEARVSDAYPLLVKAAAGGGGRGMRVVERAEDLDDAIAAARREAQAGFGDDRVFLERFLPRARHIEVQVIGDTHGNVISLGERECSLQRRHQKVIEESPSPVVSHELRDVLGREAVALAQRRRLHGAGTVEFIADADDPVDALLPGDERAAAGRAPGDRAGHRARSRRAAAAGRGRRGARRRRRRSTGHAIEARINAEDAQFFPSAGPVVLASLPARRARRRRGRDRQRGRHRLRLDDRQGDRARPATARPRWPASIARWRDTAILGLETNIGFLRTLLARDDVRAGEMDTGLIGRMEPAEAAADRRGGRPRRRGARARRARRATTRSTAATAGASAASAPRPTGSSPSTAASRSTSCCVERTGALSALRVGRRRGWRTTAGRGT